MRVQAYGDGIFRIAGRVYRGSILLWPDRCETWPVSQPRDVNAETLAPFADTAADILIVGCGPRFVDPPKDLRPALRDAGMILEWMDTGAACRTFNVLVAEERRVAAALIAVP